MAALGKCLLCKREAQGQTSTRRKSTVVGRLMSGEWDSSFKTSNIREEFPGSYVIGDG